MKTPKWMKIIKSDRPGKSADIQAEIKTLEADMAASQSTLKDIEDRLREAQISALANELDGPARVEKIEAEKKLTLGKIEAARSVIVDLEKAHGKAVISERIARQGEIQKELATLETKKAEMTEELFTSAAKTVFLMQQVAGHSRVRCDGITSPLPAVGEYRETFFAGPLREMHEKAGEPLGIKIQKLKYEHAQLRVSGRHA